MQKIKIPFHDFSLDYKIRGKEYREAFSRVMKRGWYILGPEVELFEKEFSNFLNVKHTVGVANGLEAIQIALMALDIGKGDEIITTPLSAIATTLAILAVGAKPVFVDINENGLIDIDKIEDKITKKTKVILPVHLYGNSCNLDKLLKICKKNNLYLVEDAAQAHGALYKGKAVGGFGSLGCFSFYPTKNLGAIGDAGAVVTNDDELAKRVRRIRDYGQSAKYVHEEYGLNSRLDELQASLLRVKLKYLPYDTEKRRKIADKYDDILKDVDNISPLELEKDTLSARHLYVVKSENRDVLAESMQKQGIATLIHYPVIIPDQPLFKNSEIEKVDLSVARNFVKNIISIPISNLISNNLSMVFNHRP